MLLTLAMMLDAKLCQAAMSWTPGSASWGSGWLTSAKGAGCMYVESHATSIKSSTSTRNDAKPTQGKRFKPPAGAATNRHGGRFASLDAAGNKRRRISTDLWSGVLNSSTVLLQVLDKVCCIKCASGTTALQVMLFPARALATLPAATSSETRNARSELMSVIAPSKVEESSGKWTVPPLGIAGVLPNSIPASNTLTMGWLSWRSSPAWTQTRMVPMLCLPMLLLLLSLLELRQGRRCRRDTSVPGSFGRDSLLATEATNIFAPVWTESCSCRDMDHRRKGQTEERSIHDSDLRGNAGHAGAALTTWRCNAEHSWHCREPVH
mmetsp:Transcript_19216/g.34804  ORF Transcript_19216/g.34804 Transcript_19216/m.34804 type:complete len:322 (-) Transcript_19216:272-1237(-)